MNQDAAYAVLTGDLVKSSKMSGEQRQSSLKVISELSERLPDLFKDLEIIGPEIFRGDSWQMLIAAPKYALHVVGYEQDSSRHRATPGVCRPIAADRCVMDDRMID